MKDYVKLVELNVDDYETTIINERNCIDKDEALKKHKPTGNLCILINMKNGKFSII